jgi:hypothetical protein
VKIKSLIPDISPPPGFEKQLLEEYDRQNFSAEIRALRQQGQLALAASAPKPRRRAAVRRTPVDRWQAYASLIVKASRKAGANNLIFCKLLDLAKIPVPQSWGVKTWALAWATPKLRPAVRTFKSRHKSPAKTR